MSMPVIMCHALSSRPRCYKYAWDCSWILEPCACIPYSPTGEPRQHTGHICHTHFKISAFHVPPPCLPPPTRSLHTARVASTAETCDFPKYPPAESCLKVLTATFARSSLGTSERVVWNNVCVFMNHLPGFGSSTFQGLDIKGRDASVQARCPWCDIIMAYKPMRMDV